MRGKSAMFAPREKKCKKKRMIKKIEQIRSLNRVSENFKKTWFLKKHHEGCLAKAGVTSREAKVKMLPVKTGGVWALSAFALGTLRQLEPLRGEWWWDLSSSRCAANGGEISARAAAWRMVVRSQLKPLHGEWWWDLSSSRCTANGGEISARAAAWRMVVRSQLEP